MVEIISCFLIAVALSMDTFSLSLGLGTYNIKQQDCLKLSLMVGVMHFLMPLLPHEDMKAQTSLFPFVFPFSSICMMLFLLPEGKQQTYCNR